MTVSKSKIFVDYSNAKKILRKLEVSFTEELQKAVSLSKNDFSKAFIQSSYKDNYSETYKIARENLDYNLLLDEDGSFFQFGFISNAQGTIEDIRYAYYEAPSHIISYEEYLEDMDLSFRECGSMFFEEYTQHTSEAELKNNATSIRYDFSIEQREEMIHPVSHLHIGQQNEIRLPVSFVMTPGSFVSFVLRHIYWNKWRIAMKDQKFKDMYLKSYSTSNDLAEILFSKEEKRDLYISFNP